MIKITFFKCDLFAFIRLVHFHYFVDAFDKFWNLSNFEYDIFPYFINLSLNFINSSFSHHYLNVY